MKESCTNPLIMFRREKNKLKKTSTLERGSRG